MIVLKVVLIPVKYNNVLKYVLSFVCNVALKSVLIIVCTVAVLVLAG